MALIVAFWDHGSEDGEGSGGDDEANGEFYRFVPEFVGVLERLEYIIDGVVLFHFDFGDFEGEEHFFFFFVDIVKYLVARLFLPEVAFPFYLVEILMAVQLESAFKYSFHLLFLRFLLYLFLFGQ